MRRSNGRCFIPWIDNLQLRNTTLVVGVTLVCTDIPIRHHLEAYVLLSFTHAVSNTSATKLSLLKKVVIVPQHLPPSTMYLPLLKVAPTSPYKCRLKRSSAVLARVIPLASIRLNNIPNIFGAFIVGCSQRRGERKYPSFLRPSLALPFNGMVESLRYAFNSSHTPNTPYSLSERSI